MPAHCPLSKEEMAKKLKTQEDAPEAFLLIQRLDKLERAGIRKRLSENHRPLMLKLFDALAASKYYDVEKLKLKTADFGSETLQSALGKLFSRIVDELILTETGAEVSTLVQMARRHVLEEKNLPHQAQKALKKAELSGQEAQDSLLMILTQRSVLADLRKNLESPKLAEGIARLKDLARKLQVDYALSEIYDELVLLANNRDHSSGMAKKNAEQVTIFEARLRQLESEPLSLQNQIMLFVNKQIIALIKRDDETAFRMAKAALDLLLENEVQIEKMPRHFQFVMDSYLHALMVRKMDNEFERYLELTRSHLPMAGFERIKFQLNHLYWAFLFYLNTGNAAQAAALVPEAEKFLIKNTNINKTREASFKFNIACYYFLAGKWKEAQKKINDVLSFDRTNRPDLQTFSRILTLIVRWEMNDVVGLESDLRQAIRHTEKDRTEFETIFLKFIRTLISTVSPPQSMYGEALAELQPLVDDKDNIKPLGHDEVMLWLHNRITGLPMMELVRLRSGGADLHNISGVREE